MISCSERRSCGFTLVELLVVIVIIGVLVALLLPAIQAAREAARRTECQNHLKQIGLAIQLYHDAQGTFPMGRDRFDQFGLSWSFRVLPQLEEQPVYTSLDKTKRVDDEANTSAMRTPVETYACPSRRPAAADRNFDNNDSPPDVDKRGVATLSDYSANAGHTINTGMDDAAGEVMSPSLVDTTIAGPMYSGSRIAARRVTDGLSTTLAVGERHIPPVDDTVEEALQHWRQGDTAALAGDTRYTVFCGTNQGLAQDADDMSNGKFGGPHPGVTMFVFLDGHVDAIANSIETAALTAMSTIAGGEVISR